MPSEETTAGLKILDKMEDSRTEFFNMIPTSVDQTLQLVGAVQLPELIRKSPATDPVGNDGVWLPGHGKLPGKDLEEKRPEREDVVAARRAADGPWVCLEPVGPSLKQLGAGVDDIGIVGRVVQQGELDLVFHEHVPGAETPVDDALGM